MNQEHNDVSRGPAGLLAVKVIYQLKMKRSQSESEKEKTEIDGINSEFTEWNELICNKQK